MVMGVASNPRGEKEVASSCAACILGPTGMSECCGMEPTIGEIEEAKTTHCHN